MKYYAGLDVSLKETSICVVTQDGEIIKEGNALTDPTAILIFLADTKLSFDRIGLETGNLTPWLYHALKAAGMPVVCLEARHAKAAMRAQRIKTDRNDARGLAHIMRTGWYRAVHVKSDESQKLRVLLNNRRYLLERRIDIENQIRGTLKVFGRKTGVVGKAGYEARIMELIAGDGELALYIMPLLEVRLSLLEQEKKLDKEVRRIVRKDEICLRLMTIPGVGELTALVFKTGIDNPHRFRNSRDVGAHFGLTPRKYASGEIDYNGRISKCGDSLVRSHLFEAAKVLMSRVTKWSSLKSWGMRVARRGGMKKACVAVARKLSVIMHRMWLDGSTFRWGSEEAKQAAGV